MNPLLVSSRPFRACEQNGQGPSAGVPLELSRNGSRDLPVRLCVVNAARGHQGYDSPALRPVLGQAAGGLRFSNPLDPELGEKPPK